MKRKVILNYVGILFLIRFKDRTFLGNWIRLQEPKFEWKTDRCRFLDHLDVNSDFDHFVRPSVLDTTSGMPKMLNEHQDSMNRKQTTK